MPRQGSKTSNTISNQGSEAAKEQNLKYPENKLKNMKYMWYKLQRIQDYSSENTQ